MLQIVIPSDFLYPRAYNKNNRRKHKVAHKYLKFTSPQNKEKLMLIYNAPVCVCPLFYKFEDAQKLRRLFNRPLAPTLYRLYSVRASNISRENFGTVT